MKEYRFLTLIGSVIFTILSLLSCGNDDNEIDLPYVRYSVDLQVIREGFNGTWCWFHPRAAKYGNNSVKMLMQPMILGKTDFFEFLHEVDTKDGGFSWSEPKILSDSLGEIWENGVMLRLCDVTPQWHQASKKILATAYTVRYRDSVQFTPCPRETSYFSYDPKTDTWSSWKRLKMPDLPEFFNASVGCSQWVDLPNGDVLLPIYLMRDPNVTRFAVTVLRCHFDGKDLVYKEHGNILESDIKRGYYEPSLIEFNGKYYLTLRNDINGAVTTSTDGLHYDEPREWMFNDSTSVWSENTQQHWVKSPRALFLVYTSSHREESANVMRGRAPLFIAQFDEKNMVLMKETEQILIPNNSGAMGNFGAFDLNTHESWVTAAERTDNNNVKTGANGRVYVARVKWSD